MYNEEKGVMNCSWCSWHDKNGQRNQFVKGCSTMKLESVKKHEQFQQHKDA